MAEKLEIIATLKDQVTGEVKKMEGGLKGLSGGFKSLTGFSLGGAAAIGAVATALHFSIKAAADAQRVMAQTEAIIKATGGAAGLTAEEIATMSLNLSRVTGIEDEVVQSGNNMLLTFKNIGEDVFPRTSAAMLDMAVALNQGSLEGLDLKDTAIQLGKALNDPIRGVTALTKAGVTFTAEQRNAIRAMVDANDIAGAQAIILQELETEFGGAAEAAGSTYAGAVAKATNEVGNLAESLGTLLLPAFTQVASEGATWLTGLNALIAAKEDGTITTGEFTKSIFEMGFTVDANTIIMDLNARKHREVQDVYQNTKDDLIGLKGSVEEYSGAVDANGALVDEVAEATRKFTDQLLFNKAAQYMTADAALEFGRKLGLVDDKTVLLNQLLPVLTEKFDSNRDGLISAQEAAGGYTSSLLALKNAAESAAGDYFIDVYVTTHGKVPVAPGKGEPAIPFHSGADFIVPPGYPNDSFGPIYVESGEHVRVTPRDQVMRGTNITNNFSLNYTGMRTEGNLGSDVRMLQMLYGR